MSLRTTPSGAIHDLDDLPFLLAEIEHFAAVYKDVEPGKSVETRGWKVPQPRRSPSTTLSNYIAAHRFD